MLPRYLSPPSTQTISTPSPAAAGSIQPAGDAFLVRLQHAADAKGVTYAAMGKGPDGGREHVLENVPAHLGNLERLLAGNECFTPGFGHSLADVLVFDTVFNFYMAQVKRSTQPHPRPSRPPPPRCRRVVAAAVCAVDLLDKHGVAGRRPRAGGGCVGAVPRAGGACRAGQGPAGNRSVPGLRAVQGDRMHVL